MGLGMESSALIYFYNLQNCLKIRVFLIFLAQLFIKFRNLFSDQLLTAGGYH